MTSPRPHIRDWCDVGEGEDDDDGGDVIRREKRALSVPFCFHGDDPLCLSSRTGLTSDRSCPLSGHVEGDHVEGGHVEGDHVEGGRQQHSQPRGRRCSMGSGEDTEWRPGLEWGERKQRNTGAQHCGAKERGACVINDVATDRRSGENCGQETERFGENSSQEMERFGENSQETERFGENSSQETERFGENSSQETERFGENSSQETKRFGENSQEMERFGENSSQETERFGENSSQETERFGENSSQETERFCENCGQGPESFVENSRKYTDSRFGESSKETESKSNQNCDEEKEHKSLNDDEEKSQRNITSHDEENQIPVSYSDDNEQTTPAQNGNENPTPSTNTEDLKGRASTDSDDISSDDDGNENSFRHAVLQPKLEGWKALPAILLEDIFALLSPKQRHQASMVCQAWYDIFYSPRVWHTFVLWERTLTKRRFNLYKGYQRELCPRKTQLCLMRVGRYIRHIVVTAISDYYNLYEFLRVLSSFLSFHPTFPMPLLSSFTFTFACESRGVNGTAIIGTGGNILSKLKDLVSSMQGLSHLTLNQLLLEEGEVGGVVMAAAASSDTSLLSLELLNCSKVPVAVCEVTQFIHLQTLKVSPQHLNEEMILLLGGTPLLRLHLIQDPYTCPCSPLPPEAWKLFREMAPDKRVFLEIQGRTKTPLLIQPHAPVRGVVIRTPYHQLGAELTLSLLQHYAKTLEYLVQEGLPRAHGSRHFPERADERLLRVVGECPRLHTLVVRERLSLATMLLLARQARGLRTLTLRRNALLKRCEWPRAQAWTGDFYHWLRRHGRDYDLAFSAMPVILGRPWKPAVDKVFKHLHVTLT